jgi:protocatechuate 3,4-dioxygenase beta subunit
MRAAALVATALALCGAGDEVRAQQLTVSGRVVDDRGDPAPGVEVRLLAEPTPFEQGLLELAGRAVPEAVDAVKTGDDGRFALTVPEAGFWQLTAEAPGSVPFRYAFGFAPLLDSTLLPTLELQPAHDIDVTVYGGDDEAAAGAWVQSELTEPPPRRMSEPIWLPLLPRVRASETGEATLSSPVGAALRVRAWRADHQASDEKRVEGGAARVHLLEARARHLTVRDADDRPVVGAVVRVGDLAWPAGRTDENGAAVIHDREALIALADGRVARVDMADEEGTPQTPFEVLVPDAVPLAGRVLDADTRRGVARAFVAPQLSVAGHVRTDARGSFTLDSSSREHSPWITAAARGYLETTHLPSARTEVTLTLEPAVDLHGAVFDSSGDPVANAEVVATPHGTEVRRLSRIFGLPVRRTASDSQGEFVVPRLPRKSAYSVTARSAGFAPAEVVVSDPAAIADSGGIVLRLESGTLVTGKIVAPTGRAVPGAEVTLERQAENTVLRYRYAGRAAAHAFKFHSRSDGEGEFTFANIPVGRFHVGIEAPGFADESVPTFEIEPGMRTHDLGVVALEEGVALAGRVEDPQGTPLAGAEVAVSTPRHSWNSVPSPPVMTTTDNDGSFTVEDRREGEFLGLEVALAGYARQSLERVEVPRPSDFVIVLQPALTLRGRVVDPGGEAIAQAQVDVLREGGGGSFGGRVFNRAIASGHSDESGWFEIADIEPATVRVTASADGWLTRELGGLELVLGEDLEELEIELQPGSAIEGRVIAPDGTPQTGATVRVEDLVSFSRLTMAATDGDGRYRLGGLEAGHHVVVASTEDGLRSSREIEVRPGDNTLDFYLEGGVTVSGSVVDSSSEPIEGAAVMLRSEGRSGFRSSRLAQSDAAGAFIIENVSPGLFHVSAEHPDHASAELEPPLEVREQPVAGLLLRLDDGARITGTLVGAAPRDLVSMQVVAIRQPLSYKEGRVESDGTYTIGNLSAGIWTVTASSATGLQAQEPIEIGPGERAVTLDLDFGGGLTLTGRILRRGKPLTGASVWVAGVERSGRAWGESDYEGRFRLEGLEPGRYRLQISDFGSGTSHAEEIEMVRDEEILIELEGGTVSGRVTAERGGAPLAGVSIVLEPRADSGARLQAKGVTSDDSGSFRLEEVSPGEYDLLASKAGYAAQARSLRITGDAEIAGVDLALSRVEGLTLDLRLPVGGAPSTVSYAVLDPQDKVFMSGSAPVTNEGRVRLTTIPDGSWTILLKASGAAIRTIQADAPQEELVVALQPAAQLQVRIEELTQDSSAVATLRVVASDGRPFKSIGWRGLEDRWRLYGGHVSVDGLPPGRWILNITTTDDRSWQRSVALAAGVNDTVVFD